MSKSISIFKDPKQEEIYMALYEKTLTTWPIPYQTTYIPTEIGDTHVVVCGPEEAKPVVLLHGATASATMWYANVEEIGSKFRLFAVDTVTDIGKSGIKKLPRTRQEQADWLKELLQGLGIDKPHMAGLSYGGYLTMNFACYYPELVDKIVLLAPAAVFKRLSAMFWIQALSSIVLPFKGRVEGFVKWMTAVGNELDNAYTDQFKFGMGKGKPKLSVMPSVFSDEELKSIQNPALLMVGDQEVIYDGPAVLDRAKRLMPNVQTESVTQCGHGVAMEQPEFVNQRIMAFLTES